MTVAYANKTRAAAAAVRFVGPLSGGQMINKTSAIVGNTAGPRTLGRKLDLRPRRKTVCFSLIGLALALSGCVNQTATAPLGARVNQRDVDFVTNLYNVTEFDKLVIGNLLTKEPSPRINELARTMLTEAEAFEARVAPIAAREGILPPKGQRFVQRADLQVRIASAIGSDPIDFDKEFLSDEIYSHKIALESARLMSLEPGGNPELIKVSEDAERALEENLARLERLRTGKIVEKD